MSVNKKKRCTVYFKRFSEHDIDFVIDFLDKSEGFKSMFKIILTLMAASQLYETTE